ncbi:MAG: hypothetical protein R3322_00170 [Kiloniellales bacterium]|nr:hypothetical protein [Kiloniellales bacterium]
MKTLTVPPPVTLPNGDDLSFAQWVEGMTSDRKFGASAKTIFQAVEIIRLVKEANGTVQLDTAHWELLRDVISEPSAPYNPAIMIHAAPFLRAVLEPKE